jgi:hypothetical protein
VDELFAELLAAGEEPGRVRAFLEERGLEDVVVLALLRRPVPVRFLEHVATRPPWSQRPLLLGAVAGNPRTPRALALRVLPALFWRDLALVAGAPRVAVPVRMRAEALLKETLADLRLGERVALGKIAPRGLLATLLADPDRRVLQSCLMNPRLREEDLLMALRGEAASRALLEVVAATAPWGDRYGIRLGLVLQPRTPLPLALAQISSLARRDLLRVSRAPGLVPLVQIAAARLAAQAR